LVRASSTIALYTEREVGTWQSIPELNFEPGDFTSDTANIDTAPSTTSNQHREGDDGHSEGVSDMASHHKNAVNKRVTFSDQAKGRIMRSRAIVQIRLQLNQMNGECQTTLILILVV
jgi:hypothetical protein